MLTHILLSIVIVTIAGLAFALTSHKLGRGDKRIGCGAGKCGACNPDNAGAACPNESDDDDTSFLDALPVNRPQPSESVETPESGDTSRSTESADNTHDKPGR